MAYRMSREEIVRDLNQQLEQYSEAGRPEEAAAIQHALGRIEEYENAR